MGRRVLIIVLVLVVALFVYLGYNSYDARRAGANGDVFSNDSSTSRAKNDAPDVSSPGNQTIVYPSQSQQPTLSAEDAAQGQPAAGAGAVPPSVQGETPQTGAPASDTITPNPPNGMLFSGSGKYQLYRQGNLTWRLNTDTGQSCIIFATDEEWKKPRVLRAACGKR
jgi:hypothetical protein